MIVKSRLLHAFAAAFIAIGLFSVFLILVGSISPAQAAEEGVRVSRALDLLAPPPKIYTVDTVTDENDGLCTDGDCSLRDAIIKANGEADAVIIKFDITGGCPGGCVIVLSLGPLQSLFGSEITIDGYSQPGALAATKTTPALVKIAIDGNDLYSNGLNITSGSNVIKGLAIYRFNWFGISLYGPPANNNVISGNYIGTNIDGTTSIPNLLGGINIDGNAHHNLIGGDTPAERNLISGNSANGVNISTFGNGAKDNTVSGNYIGLDASGTISLTNAGAGVYINDGGQYNTIGGNQSDDRNVISGNSLDGVYIHGSTAMSNTVSGNFIGTDPSGTIDLGNVRHGVDIDGGAKHNTIGGDAPGEKNVISGNGPSGETAIFSSGVRIYGGATMSNTVSGNYIGVDASGTISMPNDIYGVYILEGASYNLIGGDTQGERNIISGNRWDGVYIGGSSTNHNRVSGNFIGLDKNGSGEIGNGFQGVGITGSPQYNTIGGTKEGERNVISGNADNGILIISDAANNTVIGNFIGTDVSGTLKRGNGQNGVDIYNAPNNTIGGSSQGERNVISGNDYSGVRLFADSTSGNTVIGNFIGTDASGKVSLGNGEYGVEIANGAHDNTIGSIAIGEGNQICDSRFSGVSLQDSGTTGNQIIGNSIGTAEDKTTDLGNGGSGVRIRLGAQDNIIGPGNMIAFNYHGVTVRAIDTFGNTITQNSIYTNDYMGIYLENNANKDITAPVISDAAWGSIEVTGTACADCLVELFESINNDGEGKRYVGDDFADSSGDYVITVSHLIWPYLTATATDVISGTSEFSGVYTSPFRSIFLPIVFKD